MKDQEEKKREQFLKGENSPDKDRGMGVEWFFRNPRQFHTVRAKDVEED